VVAESLKNFGLSGELAARALEAGLRPAFARVCVDDTLPFARHLEEQALPNVPRIVDAAHELMKQAVDAR
jgi:pyruvate/2-oxoglutarate/acetoin dehydrogenase E1 component